MAPPSARLALPPRPGALRAPRVRSRLRVARGWAFIGLLTSLSAAQERLPAAPLEVDGRAYLAQPAGEEGLRLTPNTCFFEGSGLRARGAGPDGLSSPELNKGQSFASVTGFTGENRIVWFVHVARPGAARLSVEADPGVFRWSLGDLEGAVLTLEVAGSGPIKADDPDSAVDASLRILLFEGFQRWFPPVLYFLLLGPVAAVGYRLIVMGSNDRQVPLGSLRHFLDWLPSRVLLLTFGIVGNFEAIRPVLAERSFDADIATDELLLEALEVAMPAQTGEVGDRAEQLRQGLQSALVVWVLVASILVIVS